MRERHGGGDRWEVVFYETAQGERPAEEWLRRQDVKVQARLARILDMLEEHGTNVKEPFVSHLRDKLWEVRVEHHRVRHRLLYFPAPTRKFVVLHGFVKKTPKTPAREMEVAEARIRDYMNRSSGV